MQSLIHVLVAGAGFVVLFLNLFFFYTFDFLLNTGLAFCTFPCYALVHRPMTGRLVLHRLFVLETAVLLAGHRLLSKSTQQPAQSLVVE
jgi:hypothetical protein